MEAPRLNSKRTHLHSSNVITPSLFVSTLAKNWSSLDCVTRRPERRNAACSSPLSSLPFLSWSILLNSAYSWCSVSLTNSENSLIKVSNVLANDGALSGGQLFAGDQLTIERYLAIPIRIHSLHNILKKCIRIPQCYKPVISTLCLLDREDGSNGYARCSNLLSPCLSPSRSIWPFLFVSKVSQSACTRASCALAASSSIVVNRYGSAVSGLAWFAEDQDVRSSSAQSEVEYAPSGRKAFGNRAWTSIEVSCRGSLKLANCPTLPVSVWAAKQK